MYRSAARLAGMKLSFFHLDRDEDVMLERIKSCLENGETASLLLNFPNNPTGISVSSRFYKRLGEFLPRDVPVINDFVYGEMCFKQRYAPSILAEASLRERAVETYSLSKAYSVPGWRIGAISGSRNLVRAVSRLKSYVDYGAFLPLQLASTSLLSSPRDLVESVRDTYAARGRLLVQGLKRLGWDADLPDAGACVWARLPEKHRNRSSLAFSEAFLETMDVVVMPGTLFGEDFDQYVRFALVNSEERIQELLLRLERFSYD